MNGEFVKLVESLSKEAEESTKELKEAIDPVNQKTVVQFIKSFDIDFDEENGIFVKGGQQEEVDVNYSPEGSSGKGASNEDEASEKRLEEGLKESLAMSKRFVKNEIKGSINIAKAYFKEMGIADEGEKKQVLNHLLETYNARVVMSLNLIPPESVDDTSLRDSMRQDYIAKANNFTIFKGVDEEGNDDIKMYAKKYPFEAYKIEKILKDLNFKEISSEQYAEEMIGPAQEAA